MRSQKPLLDLFFCLTLVMTSAVEATYWYLQQVHKACRYIQCYVSGMVQILLKCAYIELRVGLRNSLLGNVGSLFIMHRRV
jgi:hypothetical protein